MHWKVFHPTLLRLKENRSQINTPITMGLKKLSCKVSIYPQSHYFLNPNDGAWLNGCHSKPPSSVLVAEPQLRVLLAIHSRFGSYEVLSGYSMMKFQPWPLHLTESRDHWFEIWFTWMIWFAWMNWCVEFWPWVLHLLWSRFQIRCVSF